MTFFIQISLKDGNNLPPHSHSYFQDPLKVLWAFLIRGCLRVRMKQKRLLGTTEKNMNSLFLEALSIWSSGDKHSFNKADPKGRPQGIYPDLHLPRDKRAPCSLGLWCGMKGRGSLNIQAFFYPPYFLTIETLGLGPLGIHDLSLPSLGTVSYDLRDPGQHLPPP